MKTYQQFVTEAHTVLSEATVTGGAIQPRSGNALTRLRDRVGQAISPVTRPVNRFMGAVQPFRNFERFRNAQQITNPNTSLLDKGKAALGIVAPFTTMTGDAILNQTKTGSGLDQLTQAASKHVHIPVPGTGIKIGQNPKTDLGRKLSDKIGSTYQRTMNALGGQVKRYNNWAKNNNVRAGY